jgi:hypothetical protein
MLGKFAIRRRDLAFRTDATPATDAVQVNAQLACSGQNRSANGEMPAFAGGSKNDKRISGHSGAFGFRVQAENMLFNAKEKAGGGIFMSVGVIFVNTYV